MTINKHILIHYASSANIQTEKLLPWVKHYKMADIYVKGAISIHTAVAKEIEETIVFGIRC